MSSSSERLSNDDLTAIRQTSDWRQLFNILQIEKDPKKSREQDWWGMSPFNPAERTASFHINDRGWYCHSTGQGGGVIELVQQLHPTMSCYDAGRWLIEQGVSQVSAEARGRVEATLARSVASMEVMEENLPIRQDLRSQLETDHPAFAERGIPVEVLVELGAGYLERPPRKNERPDPINQRLVFQIRGVREGDADALAPVILGHIGRATTMEQAQQHGKWWTFAGFRKSLEIYNIDLMLHDEVAHRQTEEVGHILVVEGCFDVAKLYAAGIRNVVATLGARMSPSQVDRLDLLSEITGFDRFLLWYDRDQDGATPNGMGALHAAELLTARGFEVEVFDWRRQFRSSGRGGVSIPAEITDPCEFSVEQLRWLRQKEVI